MDSPSKTQAEILEGVVTQLREQDSNQTAIVEIFRQMQNRNEGEGRTHPTTEVLGEFRQANPPSFVGTYMIRLKYING